MDFIKTYGTIIAAFVGALVGSSIKEISTLYQLRREDKRQLKNCLFNQLELRFEVSRYDTSKVAELVINFLSVKMIASGCTEEQVAIMKDQVVPQLNSVIKQIKLGEPDKLREQYQGVVNGLAKIDPILAYKISGRASVDKFLNMIKVLFDEADKQLGVSPNENEQVKLRESMTTYLEGKVIKDVLDQTKKDIYSIARRISLVTLIQAFMVMKRSERRLQEEIQKEFDEFMTELITHFGQSSNAIKVDKG